MHFKLFPELSVIQFNADMSSVKTIFVLDCHHFYLKSHIAPAFSQDCDRHSKVLH